MNKNHFTFFLGLYLVLSACLPAQNLCVFGQGNAGLNVNYVGGGVKLYTPGKMLLRVAFGGGLLGSQSELSVAGNAPNLSGQTGFDGGISSSIVVPADPSVPQGFYPGSVDTRFTGFFTRVGYEWFFPSKKDTGNAKPSGLHLGAELGWFFIKEHQDIQYRSFSTSDIYITGGNANCMAIAPGLALGYDLCFWKKFQFAPEIALPFYFPIGHEAKSNGPFAKATVEFRLGIGWFFK